MSEVLKIAGRLGRMHVSSSSPRPIERAAQSVPVPEQTAAPEATVLHRRDVEDLLDAEYRRGRAEGMREARATLEEEVEKRIVEDRRKAEDFIASLKKEMDSLVGRMEHEAFKFAVAVAGKIVKREIVLDDEFIVRQIQEGIRRVVGVETLRLRVNPTDEAMVRNQKALLQAGSESLREIVIELDEKVERGGCMLETPSGTVDARTSTQLEQIEAALFGQVVS